ncbi:unnamed protein product [Mortierella alpina]
MSIHHPRKQQRQTLASLAGKRQPRAPPAFDKSTNKTTTATLATVNALDQGHDQDQDKVVRALAERVYVWATNELDYRPKQDAKNRVVPRSTSLITSGDSERGDFGPSALVSLCDGPCGPMLEYLAENMKPRSIARVAQLSRSSLAKHPNPKLSLTEDKDQKSRMVQCRELAFAVACKQREIENVRERIKQQRQLQAIKHIHLQQSAGKVTSLQKVQPMLQQASVGSSVHEDEIPPQDIKIIFERALGDTLRIVRAIALDCVSEEHERGTANETFQELCQQLTHNRSAIVPSFLELIQALKEAQLHLLSTSKKDWLQQRMDTNGGEGAGATNAYELLQLFREHHIERVVQIESVYNRISTCEQEKEKLYSKLRYRAQKRDQEKRPNTRHQELEETKASLQGLTTALEFIQAEQENLVERVMSMDEQHSKLEALNKASRMAGQQMNQLNMTIAKLIEMTKLNCTSVPTTALSISDEIRRSLSEGMTQLSALVQDQISMVENGATTLRDLTETSQRRYMARHVQTLQAPTPDAFEEGASLSEHVTACQWRKVAAASSLSLDRHILQVARLLQDRVARNMIVAQAKDLNKHMEQVKDRMALTVKSSAAEVLQGAGTDRKRLIRISAKDEDNNRAAGDFMNIDNLDSRFEVDVKNAIQTIGSLDQTHHAEFQRQIQDTLTQAESGGGTVRAIRGLAHDRVRIASTTTRRTKSGDAFTAQGKDGKRPWFGPQ